VGTTVQELADDLSVDPGDIEVLVAAYPDDEDSVWEEEGVLSNVACGDIQLTLNAFGIYSSPEIWWPETSGQESVPR
jgi:hypothetical protein